MTILLSCQNSFDCPPQFIYYTLSWQDPNSSHKIALSEMWWKSSDKIPLGEKPQINYTYFKKRQYRQQWYQKELTFALVLYVLLLWAPISLLLFFLCCQMYDSILSVTVSLCWDSAFLCSVECWEFPWLLYCKALVLTIWYHKLQSFLWYTSSSFSS